MELVTIGPKWASRGVLSAAVLAGTLASLVVSSGSGTAAVRSRPREAPSAARIVNHMYWGAWIANRWVGGEAPWEMGALSAFAGHAGKAPSLVNFSTPFVNCVSGNCTPSPFPEAQFNNVRRYGAIPFFSWGSDSLPFSVNEPKFSLGAIANGSWDAYIANWATAAKSWRHPFFLRFDWEMNGHWFPWAEGVNGNTTGQYVQAWRHVHDIFGSVGATNATWVWCPTAPGPKGLAALAALYPGDAYVDWTCIDGYNRGLPWRSFGQIFGPVYDLLTSTIAPSKPLLIGETASTEMRGSKSAWIADMLSTQLQKRYPKVKAFLWFDKGQSPNGWPIETSSASTAAFAAGIAAEAYAPNRFGSIDGGRIQPLP